MKNLSPFQNLLVYYARLQESYGWTMREIDEHEIKFLLGQLAALRLIESAGEKKFIEDVI